MASAVVGNDILIREVGRDLESSTLQGFPQRLRPTNVGLRACTVEKVHDRMMADRVVYDLSTYYA